MWKRPGAHRRPPCGYGLIRKLSTPGEKFSAVLGAFQTYIRNNQEYIPNYDKLYRQGETISPAFVEFTIN
jgi:hypothetical protein